MKRYIFLCWLIWVAVHVYGQAGEVAVISSQYDESNAVLAPDGKSLYFSIANHILNSGGRKDGGDIWYSQVNDAGTWSTPTRLQGPVNNNKPNRVLGFSADGLTMFLHGHYPGGGADPDTQGISVSQWNGRVWTNPVNIYIPYFQNRSRFQSGHISEDEELILFSIESYKGEGNEDIYVSFKQDNGYSEPMNLGPDINTKYQEFTPYLSSDKKILFFSSNGRGGNGSSDVLYSERLDDTWKRWSEPRNLGGWVNTDGKDWNFLMIDRIRKVLFISTRSSDGYGDIHIITPREGLDTLFTDIQPEVEMEVTSLPDMPLTGSVEDQVGVPISSASLELTWDGGSEKMITGEDGVFFFDLEPNREYNLNVRAGNYIPQQRSFSTDSQVNTRNLTFRLLYAEVGTTVNLENVLFAKGTSNMLPGSDQDLQLVVELMNSNPNIEIELSGHTDNNGDPKKNLKLSKQRVKVIEKYLEAKGINGSRIKGKGYGDTRPIASNATEETRRLNRRVEFTIVKN